MEATLPAFSRRHMLAILRADEVSKRREMDDAEALFANAVDQLDILDGHGITPLSRAEMVALVEERFQDLNLCTLVWLESEKRYKDALVGAEVGQ